MAIPNRTRWTVITMGFLLGLSAAHWTVPFGPQVLQGRDNPGHAPSQVENPANPSQSTISPEERGDIFMARKSYADAVDFYNRALRQPGLSSRDAAPIWNKLGIAFQQQINYQASRKAYQQAMHLRPDFGEPWNNIGTTFFLENKFKKSLKYYQHAIKLSPNSSSFHMNLGTAYYRIKKYKEAVDEYQTALTLDPSILSDRSSNGTVMETRGADADFYFYLAKSFVHVGRADEAVRYLRRAFEEGFKDHKRLETDPDIQKISQNPAYVELMKNPPASIRD
jgi:tetratricopeptide (TPR) repeat protein